jgi:hypothetical protein
LFFVLGARSKMMRAVMGGSMPNARRVALVLWFAAAPALAAEQDEPEGLRPVAALGFGYAFPFGHISNTANATMKSGVPLHLELGVSFRRAWHLVAYGEYAFVDGSVQCPGGVDCTGHALRIGGQVQWWGDTWAGQRGFIGLGGGWEQLAFGSGDDSLAWSGFEGVLSAGVLFRLTSWLSLGPYTSVSVGSFSRLTASVNGQNGEETIRNQSLHCWWVLGFRLDVAP